MKVNLYAIYDKITSVFDGPAPGHNDESMMRNFGEVVLKEGSKLNLHPEDFLLMRVGTWNDATGEIEPCEPVKVCTALDYVNKVTEIREANK
jgi:hypothetical protein